MSTIKTTRKLRMTAVFRAAWGTMLAVVYLGIAPMLPELAAAAVPSTLTGILGIALVVMSAAQFVTAIGELPVTTGLNRTSQALYSVSTVTLGISAAVAKPSTLTFVLLAILTLSAIMSLSASDED